MTNKVGDSSSQVSSVPDNPFDQSEGLADLLAQISDGTTAVKPETGVPVTIEFGSSLAELLPGTEKAFEIPLPQGVVTPELESGTPTTDANRQPAPLPMAAIEVFFGDDDGNI